VALASDPDPIKYFLSLPLDGLDATQIRQKGGQKDRKRHRQSDKLRRRVTEQKKGLLRLIDGVIAAAQ
jgi:hypothetical protein